MQNASFCNTLNVSQTATFSSNIIGFQTGTFSNGLVITGSATGSTNSVGSVTGYNGNAISVQGNFFLSNGTFTTKGSLATFSNPVSIFGLTTISNQLRVNGVTLLSNALNVYGISSFYSNANFYSNTNFYGNPQFSCNLSVLDQIVIGSGNPRVSLTINGSDSVQLPSGTTVQRPSPAVAGDIRYNTTLNQFEGFGPGSNWGSLGGVTNITQDTYVKAELTPGDTTDVLTFVTSNIERIRITSNGLIGINNSNPRVSLDISSTDAIQLPEGTTLQRPNPPSYGYIRYNTTLGQFEGFGAGSNWGSLGGVINAAQDTYIKADMTPGGSDDNLRFVTSNIERIRITSNGLIGINNSNPRVSLDISATDAIQLPEGTTLQRPNPPSYGYIRYNTTLGQFEGFGAGSNWGSLGGVINAAQDTYIKADMTPGGSDDNLRFVTAGKEIMRISSNGYIGIGTTSPTVPFQVVGSTQIIGNTEIDGTLTIEW